MNDVFSLVLPAVFWYNGSRQGGTDYGKGKKAEAEVRTNVMRLLDAAGIHYETGTYEVDENDLSGSHAADLMGIDHAQMYKTLVLKGEKKGYLVCCIPVDEELDLKKVAKAAGEKKVEMIHVKDINAITGYIRGGCTAIGMKKQYVTRIDESAKTQEQIYVSGGRIGSQIQLKPDDLAKAARAEFADIIRHEN